MATFKAYFGQSGDALRATFECAIPVYVNPDLQPGTIELDPPIWTNSGDIRVMERDPMANQNFKVITFPPQTTEHVEAFDVPATMKVTGIGVWSVLGNQFYDNSWEFDEIDVEHDGIAYKRYMDNRGYAAGERKIKVSWK